MSRQFRSRHATVGDFYRQFRIGDIRTTIADDQSFRPSGESRQDLNGPRRSLIAAPACMAKRTDPIIPEDTRSRSITSAIPLTGAKSVIPDRKCSVSLAPTDPPRNNAGMRRVVNRVKLCTGTHKKQQHKKSRSFRHPVSTLVIYFFSGQVRPRNRLSTICGKEGP